MKIPTPSVPLVLAGALAGLIFVSPALSSKGAVQQMDAPVVQQMAPNKTRPVKTAPKIAQAGLDCVKTRRSLWVESEGWIVRRVSVCR